VANLAGQFETRLDRRSPVAIWRWWIFAFVVSLLVFLSTLLFLSEDAYAKSVGKSLEGAVGGGRGGHDGGGHKGGGGGGNGGGNKGGGDSSSVKEAVDAVGGGAQRGDQALKDASGGADRVVGKASEPVSEVAGGPAASKKSNELSWITEPVADKSAEITRPLVKESDPLVEPLNDVAEPAVRTAGQVVEPVGAATDSIVEPVAKTTRPLVEPVKQVAVPVVEPIDDAVGTLSQALDPPVDPLGQIASPLASPVSETATPPTAPVDTGVGTSAAVDPVFSEGAGLHSELASAIQSSFEVSSDGFGSSLAGVMQEEISSAKTAEAPVVSKTPISKFLAALQGAVSLVEDILPIQIPQPLGAAGAAAAAGSSSGGSSSDGGSGLGILALVLVSLLSGKYLWGAREFLKPSTALIPIIERPG
jgi:hypothetical protein